VGGAKPPVGEAVPPVGEAVPPVGVAVQVTLNIQYTTYEEKITCISYVAY
jgi:hypothetical protein